MVKYKEYFLRMCQENKQEFAKFQTVHHAYALDKATHQDEYNSRGAAIVGIIRDWESRLCSTMEKGKNSTYSARLSEKFWDEVRKLFPLIDFVGVKIIKRS